ncbi:hypothetical protein BC826DRAFT_424547 [Russula brevipes]|nr:hypothetical protein BC826DRAFT_424547 [Russula brevipes]
MLGASRLVPSTEMTLITVVSFVSNHTRAMLHTSLIEIPGWDPLLRLVTNVGYQLPSKSVQPLLPLLGTQVTPVNWDQLGDGAVATPGQLELSVCSSFFKDDASKLESMVAPQYSTHTDAHPKFSPSAVKRPAIEVVEPIGMGMVGAAIERI